MYNLSIIILSSQIVLSLASLPRISSNSFLVTLLGLYLILFSLLLLKDSIMAFALLFPY